MKIKNLLLISFSLLLLTGFTGCTTDDPSPSPTDPRVAMVGTWSVYESGAKGSYEATIALDPSSSTGILIYNFANAGSTSNPAQAEVSSTNIYLNPDQSIGDGWTVSGGGSLVSSTKINWTYTLFDGATSYNLTAVYTKK